MWETASWFARSPELLAGYAIVFIAGWCAGLLWRALGSPAPRQQWGARLAVWGLGGALIVTFVSRLGFYDVIVDPLGYPAACLEHPASGWGTPESLLNLLLLVPFAVGVWLCCHRLAWAMVGVLVVAVGIELGQAVSGLGSCQPVDVVRNTLGAWIALSVCWLFSRTKTPRHE